MVKTAPAVPLEYQPEYSFLDRAFVKMGRLKSNFIPKMISMAKAHPRVTMVVALATIALAMLVYNRLGENPSRELWQEVGGDWVGLAIWPARYLGKTVGLGQVDTWNGGVLDLARVAVSWPLSLPAKGLNWILDGALSLSEGVPSVREMTNTLFARYLCRDISAKSSFENILRGPDAALLAPRMAGLTNLDMQKFLQILPVDQRNAFLRDWLKIPDVDVGRFGLEGAILHHFDATHLGSVTDLIRAENFAKFGGELRFVHEKEILDLLAQRSDLRVQLMIPFLSFKEHGLILDKLRNPLVSFDQLEKEIMKMVGVKMGARRPETLYELLKAPKFPELAPRLAGLPAGQWTWFDVQNKILSPDEQLGPTLELMKNRGAAMFSVTLLPWHAFDMWNRGDIIPVTMGEESALQQLIPMGLPLAYSVFKQYAPKAKEAWLQLTG